MSDIAKLFKKEIFIVHGLPKAIISDRDVKITSKFWNELFQELGTQLNFNTTYHLQIDSQTERVNQVLKDMLCMYVMENPSKWKDYLHLVEFGYNNGHQVALNMSPFKALYCKKCRIRVNWDGPVNRVVFRLELLQEMQ